MTRERGGAPGRPGVGARHANGAGWRLILGEGGALDPVDGPRNMAIDQALLDAVAAGATPAVRLYRWAPATLSFGRNQPARGLYDTAAAAERGIAFVRRPTGGQAVLHDQELTYAVAAPVTVVGKPRQAYQWINRALVAGLRSLGVAAAVAESGTAVGDGASAWTDACFRRPERGEVVVAGRKLVGSAQRTQSRTILQHGSILIGGSQAAAEELLLGAAAAAGGRPAAGAESGAESGAGSGADGWTTMEREVGDGFEVESLVAAVAAGFEEVLETELPWSSLTEAERRGVGELQRRFASAGWIWRR